MNDTPLWSEKLTKWYRLNCRKLPWRETNDPYAVWVSEIMLQQTRVESVRAYYLRFTARFPDIRALASAPEAEVLKLWEGLGYYSRARNLQKAAQIVARDYGGQMPGDYSELLKLPGIGEYTAGAIVSIAFGRAVPAIDGNVKRVAARLMGLREDINRPDVQRDLRDRLARAIPENEPGIFNQALMELGAILCSPRAPKCEKCPVRSSCDAYAEGDVESLPVHAQKALPRTVDVAVCILTYQGRVLLFRRKERLLNGLYVFDLLEEITSAKQAAETLREDGLSPVYRGSPGEAKHVFTHRIWRMKLYHFVLRKPPTEEWLTRRQAIWADARQINALPLPTAVKAARAAALEILKTD
jgi:A/G-specific adenine glycosylase